MAKYPAMPLWTDSYIADTQHLTNEEHGIYFRLLMFAWRTPECSLPNDDKRLALMVGLTPGKWAKVKETILSFWTLESDKWTQKKQQKVFQQVQENVEQKRSAGRASAKAKLLIYNKQESTDVITDVPTARVTAHPTARQRTKTKTITTIKRDTKVSPKERELLEEFKTIWEIYPKKVGTGKAEQAYIKARGKVHFDVILISISNFIEIYKNQEQRFIPLFATWLNQERWRDELTDTQFKAMSQEDQMKWILADERKEIGLQ